MNVNEFAVGALENAKWLTTMSVEGLTDEEMLFQPKPGLNNAMWLLAHIVDSGNGLILGFCKGESLLPGDWHARFGIGSRPSSNPADYQSRDEVLALMQKVHAAAIDYVKSLTPEDLDRKPPNISHLPQRAQQLFSTVGKCIYGHVTHVSGHAGQITMLRRIMGKEPRV